jgi:hypothetical protein
MAVVLFVEASCDPQSHSKDEWERPQDSAKNKGFWRILCSGWNVFNLACASMPAAKAA